MSNVVTNNEIDAGEFIVIDNDNSTATEDFSVRFNTTAGKTRTIKAGETFSLVNFPFTALYLSNSSGVAIAYRIFIIGNN